MVQQDQGYRTVGIQIESKQEERERKKRGLENIVDFNITSNAEEKFVGATLTSAEISRST